MGGNGIKKLNNKVKPYLLMIPYMFTMFLAMGSISVVKMSLGLEGTINNELTFMYYNDIFFGTEFFNHLKYTIYLSVIPTAISMLVGITIALVAYHSKNKQYDKYIQIPLIIPYAVYIFFIIITFMQTGIVSRIATSLGIITSPNDFPLLIYDNKGIGIILVYILKQVPFVYLIIVSALNGIDLKLIEAGENLGCSKLGLTFRILLPMIKENITTALLITFAFNFGAFETPYLLGNPKFVTLPVLGYKYFMSADIGNRPYAMVINILSVAISIIILSLYLSFVNNKIKSKSKGIPNDKI